MCEQLTPRTANQETFGVSDALHDGPRCEDCNIPTTEHGVCPDCIALRRELEQDDVWPVFLASLKHGASEVDALSEKLAGWKYVGADIQLDQAGKLLSIARANNLRFLAPGHRGFLAFTRNNEGAPAISVIAGKDIKFPDWLAVFTAHTPQEIILAACNAVIHQ